MTSYKEQVFDLMVLLDNQYVNIITRISASHTKDFIAIV